MQPMPVLQEQKHERFARLVATEGKSDLEAYQLAYECSYDSAHASACRLRANAGIIARITELQHEAANGAVLSLREKREYLASCVRTAPGAVDQHSPLCQSYKISEDSTEYKMPDKLTALKLDALLAKELGSNSSEAGLRLSIFVGAPAEKIVADI